VPVPHRHPHHRHPHFPRNQWYHNSRHPRILRKCRFGPSCRYLANGHCFFAHDRRPYHQLWLEVCPNCSARRFSNWLEVRPSPASALLLRSDGLPGSASAVVPQRDGVFASASIIAPDRDPLINSESVAALNCDGVFDSASAVVPERDFVIESAAPFVPARDGDYALDVAGVPERDGALARDGALDSASGVVPARDVVHDSVSAFVPPRDGATDSVLAVAHSGIDSLSRPMYRVPREIVYHRQVQNRELAAMLRCAGYVFEGDTDPATDDIPDELPASTIDLADRSGVVLMRCGPECHTGH